MKRSLLTTGIAILSVYLAGCTEPETLFRMEPVSNNTVWYRGEQYQSKTADSISVTIAFENEFQGTATFYIVIANMSSDTILASPENIFLTGTAMKVDQRINYVNNVASYDTSISVDTLFAVNPENQLAGLNQQAAQSNATYANDMGLDAATGLLRLVGDVATIGQKKSPEQRREEEHGERKQEAEENNEQLQYSAQMNSIDAQRDYWANAVLRKTTLFPNTAIGGKVDFPIDQNLKLFTIVVPVGSKRVEFEFKQTPLPGQ